MNKVKAYKKLESIEEKVSEPIVAYAGDKEGLATIAEKRDDIKCAISGEELLNKLRPRIKTLFK